MVIIKRGDLIFAYYSKNYRMLIFAQGNLLKIIIQSHLVKYSGLIFFKVVDPDFP